MDSMYFIDEQHVKNYKETILRWNVNDSAWDMQTACYILAIPKIYRKVEKYIGSFETPIDWIWFHEYKYTLSKLPEYKEAKDRVQDVPYDLTGSMVQLGKFSLNMWNGYAHFNLYDCLNSLDKENTRVLRCAIDLRLGQYSTK